MDGNKILGSNKYHKCSQLLDTTDPTVQREHNKHLKGDTDETDGSGDVETCDDKYCPPLPTYSPGTPKHHETPPHHIPPKPA